MLCLLGGIIYAGILYWANPSNRMGKSTTAVVFILRFVVVTSLLALLMSPYLLRLKKETEPPVILIAHDNSASLIYNQDSVYYKTSYLDRLDSLIKALDNQFTTVGYLFGQQVTEGTTPDYNDQQTDMSMLLNKLERTWHNKNIGAMLLFSDGLFNKGINPIFASRGLRFPVITIPLGDTTRRPDLAIHDLRYNKIVYQRSEFPVEVTISAHQAMGHEARLTLWHNNEIINEQQIEIVSNSFSKSIVFNIRSEGTGQQHYKAEISNLPQETNLTNNSQDFYVDIVQEKQRILFLAAAPHPDIGAIQATLKDHYDIDLIFSRQITEVTQPYSLVILHQLPANLNDLQHIETLMSSDPDLPAIFITGSQTNLQYFNRLQTGLNIQVSGRPQIIDAFPTVGNNFTLFTIDQTFRERIGRFPPVSAHLAEYNMVISANFLLNQKIRGIETDVPLMAVLTDSQSRKTAFISGTGIWRWRLHDFSQNGNHEAFSTLISKLINYLVIRVDNRPLQIHSDREFLINEEIKFTAELYNPSLELINDNELSMIIENEEDKKQYLFSFQPVGSAYALNAGRLPEGSYTYRAETELGGEKLSVGGHFRVLKGSLEAQNTVANHDLLYALARQTNGYMVYPEQMLSLSDKFVQDERIASVTNYNKRYEPLIGYGWLFVLLTSLLFVEWLIRKMNGAY